MLVRLHVRANVFACQLLGAVEDQLATHELQQTVEILPLFF